MRIGLVMPVVLQNRVLLDMTRKAVSKLRSSHEMRLYVICNRLHVLTPEGLRRDLRQRFSGSLIVVHEPGVERCVAAAWNYGCQRAISDRCDMIVIVANDTELKPECLDRLVSATAARRADLCSGISLSGRTAIDASAVTDGADFSCFAMLPDIWLRHGRFDENFKPAYFEDNDYYARIVLAGGSCAVVHGAQFFHHGSATVKNDPDMSRHVAHWFKKNKTYFSKKWGVPDPENDAHGVRQKYFSTPFNFVDKPLSWFPNG